MLTESLAQHLLQVNMNELEFLLEDDLYGFVVADQHQDLCYSQGHQKFVCLFLLVGAPDLLELDHWYDCIDDSISNRPEIQNRDC